MNDPKYPITPEHRTIFLAHVQKWQRLLNLMDWKIIDHTDRAKGITAVDDCLACVYEMDLSNRMVYLVLGLNDWSEPVTGERLDRLAFHELMHIRLYESYAAAAAAGDENDDTVAGPEHSVILVLENLFFDKDTE